MSTYLAERVVRARKRHHCFVCNLSIWPGQTYVRSSSVCDGSAYSLAEHHECRRVALQMMRESFEDTYYGEDVGTYLHERQGDTGLESRDELRVQARKNVAWAIYQCRRKLKA